MKREITFILVLSLFILGCNNSKEFTNRYTLRPSKENVNIRLNKNSKNLSFYHQYFKIDNVEYLALLNLDENAIEIYNINSESLFKTIKIQREGENAFGDLMAFYINNLDSIIIVNIMPKIIGIIDTTGQIINKITYDKDINNKRVKTTVPWAGQRPILVGETLHLGQVWGAEESSGILTDIGQRNCPVDVSINITSGRVQLSQMVYPEELIGKTITQMSVKRVLGYKGSFVYHFSLIDNFFITTNHETSEKLPIESNYRLILSELEDTGLKKAIYENVSHDEVVNILYDEFKNVYYVFIRKRKEDLSQKFAITTEFIYPDCFVLILDKNLNYIGEVFFPENTYSFKMVFTTPAGLYISEDHVENPTFTEDYMRFRLFTLETI